MAESLAQLLRELRAARGLSLTQTAARAQLAARTLSYWEAGTHQPRVPELQSVLVALTADTTQRAQAFALLGAARGQAQLRRTSEHQRQEEALGMLPSGGDLLRALRLRRGLPLQQVAAQMGVSEASVSRWESGKVVPPPERLDTLLGCLGAREVERAALKDGYLFLLAPMQEVTLTCEELRVRFDAFVLALYASREDKRNDLRFLCFEARAWSLASHDAEGQRLLGAICADYAAFLSGFNRFAEAQRYARRGLDLLARQPACKASLLRAAIIAAHAQVYGGHRITPERGLQLLSSWLPVASLPDFHAWMLSEMAEFLMLQDKRAEAVRLCQQACELAQRCENPNELRLRKLDLAKLEVSGGNAEQALSLVALSALDTPFRRADIELLFVEGLVTLREQASAQAWLDRAREDIRTYDLTHLHRRLQTLERRF